MINMFNKEKFHNELALRLGYERIVNDKRTTISIDDSDDPWVTLKVEGHDDIRFKASGNVAVSDLSAFPEIQNEIKEIIDAVHQTYIIASNSRF